MIHSLTTVNCGHHGPPSPSSARCSYGGLRSTALPYSYRLLSCLCSRDTWSVEQRRVLGIRAGLQFMMGDHQAAKQSSIVVTLSVGPSQTAAAHITPAVFPFKVTTFLSSPQNPVVWGVLQPRPSPLSHTPNDVPVPECSECSKLGQGNRDPLEGGARRRSMSFSSRMCGCQPL